MELRGGLIGKCGHCGHGALLLFRREFNVEYYWLDGTVLQSFAGPFCEPCVNRIIAAHDNAERTFRGHMRKVYT